MEELRCPIFIYGDAILALPEAFFFSYSGAIFEWLKVSFHCLQRRKICTICAENRRCTKSLFRVVENGKFLKRLRNGHLEKSATAGGLCPSRSPRTAKTPAKVHLRLRFQNLGKPRTAGLCGRAAGACDCGPLSCYIFERGYLPTKHLQNRYQRPLRER